MDQEDFPDWHWRIDPDPPAFHPNFSLDNPLIVLEEEDDDLTDVLPLPDFLPNHPFTSTPTTALPNDSIDFYYNHNHTNNNIPVQHPHQDHSQQPTTLPTTTTHPSPHSQRQSPPQWHTLPSSFDTPIPQPTHIKLTPPQSQSHSQPPATTNTRNPFPGIIIRPKPPDKQPDPLTLLPSQEHQQQQHTQPTQTHTHSNKRTHIPQPSDSTTTTTSTTDPGDISDRTTNVPALFGLDHPTPAAFFPAGPSSISIPPHQKRRRTNNTSGQTPHPEEPESSIDPSILTNLKGSTAAQSRLMTEDERNVMLYKRRLRNRASAARSREKQRTAIHFLTEQVDALNNTINQLRRDALENQEEIRRLREQNNALRAAVSVRKTTFNHH